MERKNKVALITGSSRGIGKSTAIQFAQNGYDVVITYLKEQAKAEALQQELESLYAVRTLVVHLDIGSEESINQMMEQVQQCFGKVDVLVNNAAISNDCVLEEKTKEAFLETLNVNLVGSFLLSQKVGQAMYEKKQGTIVFVSSANGIDTGYPEGIDYDASKAGVLSVMKNLSVAYAPYIRVNAVAPGWVETDATSTLEESFYQEQVRPITLKRFAQPEEIAKVIVFLAGEDASYINGTTIRVDGGYHY